MTDGRQTAFPGIFIESIEVEGDAFDPIPGEPTRVTERGLTKEFEGLKLAEELAEDTVGDFIQKAEEMVGPFKDEFSLIYNLKVQALPEAPLQLSSIQQRSVALRARAFARAKNPTELEMFDVTNPVKDEQLSKDGTDVYDVSVIVTK